MNKQNVQHDQTKQQANREVYAGVIYSPGCCQNPPVRPVLRIRKHTRRENRSLAAARLHDFKR